LTVARKHDQLGIDLSRPLGDDIFLRAKQQNGRDTSFEMAEASGQRVKPELNPHLPIPTRACVIEIDHMDHLQANALARC
jgi:hypothetical protein